MAVLDEIRWFKAQFSAEIVPLLASTPLSFDLICAIAFQESGELWSKLRLTSERDEVLRLSVGDTLDQPNRRAFPRDKSALLQVQDGPKMFALAHDLLVEMGQATGIEAYQHLGLNPDKFVHGYGIFQYDLQFFETDPDFFLEQSWKDIGQCVSKMLAELKKALKQLKLSNAKSLTDLQASFVGIVYNTGFGNFDQDKGLKQGFFDGKLFYGENIDRFLKIARTIQTPSTAEVATQPPSSAASSAPLTGAGRSIVDIASSEFSRFHGVDEGTQPLRGRIADYYEAGGGSRDLDPTLDENAWSAAFVSFCVKQSGATAAQFKFNLSHSVYAQAAILNEDADRGVFRGHPVGDYAPKLGDIIHHNRSGGTISFEFARAHSGYPSHAAIVVDIQADGGVGQAITIGGNEFLAGGTGTVGQKSFPLRADGTLDQSAIGPRLICVIENQLAAVAGPVLAPGPYVVNVRTDLKLRGGPGPDFPELASLADKTPLNVLEFEDAATGRWALVDLKGDGVKDGYVFAKFIDPVG